MNTSTLFSIFHNSHDKFINSENTCAGKVGTRSNTSTCIAQYHLSGHKKVIFGHLFAPIHMKSGVPVNVKLFLFLYM